MALTFRQNAVASFPLIIAVLASTGAVASTPACSGTGTGKIVQTVLDVGDAVCDALSANDVGNGDVQIVCKYINQADGIAHVFIAKVPAAQAAKMGLRTPQTVALMTAAPASAAPCASSAPSAAAPTSASAPPSASAPAPSAPSKPAPSASSKPAAKK